jgi:hypothetical protein
VTVCVWACACVCVIWCKPCVCHVRVRVCVSANKRGVPSVFKRVCVRCVWQDGTAWRLCYIGVLVTYLNLKARHRLRGTEDLQTFQHY